MAIEDQPLFPEWSAALDALNAAWSAYNDRKAFSPSRDSSEQEAAVFVAMRRFNEISDKIDT